MNIYYHEGRFINNDATIEYYKIIENAISEGRKKLQRHSVGFVYYESHHVLPKSLFPNFKKEMWNRVLLTAKEHYRCHKLLTEMTLGDDYHRMVHAFWTMATRKTDSMYRIEISEDEYAILREQFSKSRSALQTGNVCKETTKQLIGDANRGRLPSKLAITNSVNARLGKKKPADAVKRSADAQRGNTNVRGKSWWNNGVTRTMSFESPGPDWSPGKKLRQ